MTDIAIIKKCILFPIYMSFPHANAPFHSARYALGAHAR